MARKYDAIILGAGHNGLIVQAYLGRAGMRTLCLEQNADYGGGLETIESPSGSGYLHNPHSFYHRGLNRTPWYRDFELEKRGAVYIEPDLNVAVVRRDQRLLTWWTDSDKTIASVAAFDERDAETLQSWRTKFTPIVKEILIPEAQSPPLPPDERRRRLEQSANGRLLLETSALSPVEFVRREFRHPTVQAGLLFFNGLREVDPRCPGFGHHIPALLASDSLAQICIGGSRQLAEALATAVRKTGGAIRCGDPPSQILVRAGTIDGVRTQSGETFHSPLVISSLNPQQTFLELIDKRELPSDWLAKARDFRFNVLAPLFGIYLNLTEPPRYSAAEGLPELDRALMIILGLERLEQFDDIVAHHEAGTIPDPVAWGSCPTVHDETQTRSGHTAFLWEKLPYQVAGNAAHWEEIGKRHAESRLEFWRTYAPNIENAVVDMFWRSPLDTERRLPNMRFGDLLVGSFTNGQTGYHRPFPGAGHYRGHIPGLYLCGSSCHPGGNITGLPGYNCAQVVKADRELGVRC